MQKSAIKKEQIQDYLRDIEEDRNTIRTIIDTISDGIILLDDRKEIIDYNQKSRRKFFSTLKAENEMPIDCRCLS